jgi:hypothetical protein
MKVIHHFLPVKNKGTACPKPRGLFPISLQYHLSRKNFDCAPNILAFFSTVSFKRVAPDFLLFFANFHQTAILLSKSFHTASPK